MSSLSASAVHREDSFDDGIVRTFIPFGWGGGPSLDDFDFADLPREAMSEAIYSPVAAKKKTRWWHYFWPETELKKLLKCMDPSTIKVQ